MKRTVKKSNTTTVAETFSLSVASKALAAATFTYLEPQSRGMTFSAYNTIERDVLLPPFSDIVSADERGKDISNNTNTDSTGEEIPINNDATTNSDADDDNTFGTQTTAASNVNSKQTNQSTADGTYSVPSSYKKVDILTFCGITLCVDECSDPSGGGEQSSSTNNIKNKNASIVELQIKFNGDYELHEKYDRSGKQRVRCLIAVVHGRVVKREGVETVKDIGSLEYIPGSISLTFRGTDTLENVVADVKVVPLPYDVPLFIPMGATTCQQEEVDKDIGIHIHHGFREAWVGDGLRDSVLQYLYEKILQLYQESDEAQYLGLHIIKNRCTAPTVDITGHSLGGSIAVLASYDLANTLLYIGSSNMANIRCYTFGCPRVGSVLFSKSYNRLVPDNFNVINDNDLVPAIPHSPSILQRIFPAFCRCQYITWRRHGMAVILKDDGTIIINPNRKVKYRREAKVLRLVKATNSHKTKNYRDNIRAAIQNTISNADQTTAEQLGAMNDILGRLETVINEARADPTRSFHFLPGGT